MKTNCPQKELIDFMAEACHYAQEHVDDSEAWQDHHREFYLTCASYQMACFLAQNTKYGHSGVESDVVISKLCERPMKSVKQWKKILEYHVTELGGWKE